MLIVDFLKRNPKRESFRLRTPIISPHAHLSKQLNSYAFILMSPSGKNQHKFYLHFQSLQQTFTFCASVFAAEVKEMKYHISCLMLMSLHVFSVSYSCFRHGFSSFIPSFVISSPSLLLLFYLFWLSFFWIKSMFDVLFNKNNANNFFLIYALPIHVTVYLFVIYLNF